MSDEYAMGRNAHETNRLQLQAEMLAPHSAHLFRLAGITAGMRVLDVGCGAGDVAMLLAELVGPTGRVLGVDIDADILEVARARAEAAGLTTVSYLASDLTDLRLAEPVDAVTGRLILIHLDEPVAVVRTVSKLVRSGGVVTFQDLCVSRMRSTPPTPLSTKAREWSYGALSAAGRDPDSGEQVPSILRGAGLYVDGVARTGPAGTADSVMPEFVEGTIRSLRPILIRDGLATEAEVDIDTFADRLRRELKDADAAFWPLELVAAWALIP